MEQASRQLLTLLDTYICEDDSEQDSVIRARQMIAQHADIWLQSCAAGHVTGSGLVLDPGRKKVLLLYHRKLQRWLQTGGHGEDEFDPARTALREAFEESGLPDLAFFPNPAQPTLIDVDAHVIPARNEQPEHYHLDFRYLLSTASPESIQLAQAEAKELRWFAFSEIVALPLNASTLRLLRKAEKLLS
jgi:8-oxo-dGTP pyrophosphatase MutT (NUDIX family)